MALTRAALWSASEPMADQNRRHADDGCQQLAGKVAVSGDAADQGFAAVAVVGSSMWNTPAESSGKVLKVMENVLFSSVRSSHETSFSLRNVFALLRHYLE